jgi:GNAT superfamily N-acetyltransferase
MSDSIIIIRDAIPSDDKAVKEVLLDAYGQYEYSLAQEQWEAYKHNIESSVAEAQTKARLVAVVDGRIVGSVFLFDSSAKAYGNAELGIHTPIIRLLAVARHARGLGVATELIRESAKRSLEWGADTLHLHTSDIMDSAVRLYERLGFERAYDKEFQNGQTLVKSYRLHLKETELLKV